jgi:PAS domain-containing protein
VAERAERVEFVPLSLDPAEVSWVAPGRSLAALRAGRSMSLPSTPSASIPLAQYSAPHTPLSQIILPESAALVCEGGVVVQANLAAVQLAGRWFPDSLTGLALHRLLRRPDGGRANDTDAELIGPDGRAVPVRVTRWTVPGTDLLMVF